MESWDKKIQVIKGTYGEELVRGYLESNGWIVYSPATQGAHAFDNLCVKDKKNIVIAEIKTKARMTYYNATGFNIASFNEYKYIQDKYKLDVFVFFVDEFLKKIYGNKLSILEKSYSAKDGEYPKRMKNIILFSLEIMKDVAIIKESDCEFLKKASSRNYDYSKEKN